MKVFTKWINRVAGLSQQPMRPPHSPWFLNSRRAMPELRTTHAPVRAHMSLSRFL